MLDIKTQIKMAVETVKKGGVIAYPTEGVYGLGCDPFNETAVNRILSLKQRTRDKGLLLVGENWRSFKSLVDSIPAKKLDDVLSHWPGPITYLFPASDKAPTWITGDHHSIALRLPDFELVQELCKKTGPIVSTSANIATHPAAMSAAEVIHYFPDGIDFIIDAPLGGMNKPSSIIDALTGDILRG